MHIGPNGQVSDACKDYDEAKAKQVHCDRCDLSGLVTIFHDNYVGMPTMIITDHNGEEREVLARTQAHCSCEVGKWMRSCVKSDVLRIIPPLSAVGHGRLKHWSPVDPRFADIDDTEMPDWKAVRRWLATINPNQTIKTVRPEYDGNRNQARREMGITPPAKSGEWKP